MLKKKIKYLKLIKTIYISLESLYFVVFEIYFD